MAERGARSSQEQPVRLPGETQPGVELRRGSLIGAGAVLLRSLLEGVRDGRARKAECRAAQTAELKHAMREYLTALDAVERVGLDPTGHFIARLVRRVVYGQRIEHLSDRLAAASAHMRLVAPAAVDDLMREAEELGDRYSSGDKQWRAEWIALPARLRTSFRQELDEPDRAQRGTGRAAVAASGAQPAPVFVCVAPNGAGVGATAADVDSHHFSPRFPRMNSRRFARGCLRRASASSPPSKARRRFARCLRRVVEFVR